MFCSSDDEKSKINFEKHIYILICVFLITRESYFSFKYAYLTFHATQTLCYLLLSIFTEILPSNLKLLC